MTQEKPNRQKEWDAAATLKIQGIVAEAYKLTVEAMLARCRDAELVLPRQIAMALARELTLASLPDIAEAFRMKNHMTVMYACRSITARCQTEKGFKATFRALRDKCAEAIKPGKPS